MDKQELTVTVLRQIEEDAKHAISKAVGAFVKQGFAVKYQQPGRAAEAVNEFDAAIAELRQAVSYDSAIDKLKGSI